MPAISIDLPHGANSDEVKKAVEEALRDVSEATREAASPSVRHSTTVIRLGDFLTNLALLWILSSAVIKVTYKGRIQAEARADQATETAEAESLKRQVIEARMAAMQAQVEPHFLFNTLASIDHLIETDPPRASQMQKNLIALLRASMPTMREANAGGVRDLGRELAVIKPYLEILKVRMEERLLTEI
ncbi:histidine kinase, partial [Roseateles sp. GG27B]